MKYILLAWLGILLNSGLQAQAVPYRVVFDLTSGDTAMYRTVTRWIDGITKGDPDAEIEVVLYGKALAMITQGKSNVSGLVEAQAANPKVRFNACEMAMKRHNLPKESLIKGVSSVPDAIYELISKQAQGWGYIKVSQ